MTTPLLALERVRRTFPVKRQTITAVEDVSLTLERGDVLCLVGELGCGKTTTGKMIAGLLAPSGGQIRYAGQDITTLRGADYNKYRLAVQLIHQDPYASLNPSRTIYETLAAPIRHHGLRKGETAVRQRVRELMELVDLTPPDDLLDKFPHQLSGGQRQRVSIARALTVEPALLVADEAVSMVDVSIRISLLRTLTRLKDQMGLAVVFITHDLAMAKYFAWHGQIGVMYLGRLVELASARTLISQPQHPYTQALLAAIPEPDPEITRSKRGVPLRSMDIPSLLRVPPGCAFHPRCPYMEPGVCDVAQPALTALPLGSAVACHPVIRRGGWSADIPLTAEAADARP